MSNRLFRMTLVVFLAISGLALTRSRAQAGDDLGTFSGAQLERSLGDQLDAIHGEPERGREYPLEVSGARWNDRESPGVQEEPDDEQEPEDQEGVDDPDDQDDQDDPDDQEEADLDTFTDEQLAQDLGAELDDIYGDLEPDGEYPLDELQAAIMGALSDEGDEDDEQEAQIDEAQLDREMQEAGTTLVAVVKAALVEADELASWRGAPSFRLDYTAFGAAAQDRNRRNGFSRPRVATQQVLGRLLSTIRAR